MHVKMTPKEDSSIMDYDNTKYKDGVNRNARLIVRNISFKATEESLREHFSPYGSLEEVKLLKKPDGKLVGCAFIHYSQVPMANKAIAATNRKPFMGRSVYVSWAVPKHKYDDQTQEKPKPKSKSVASDGDHDNAIKSENSIESKKNKKEHKERLNRKARLIIRNVSFKATEESLKEHFEPYGTIIDVKLLKKPDGKLVGCAFVHFKNVPMAKKALLNTNMKPFLGRPISVDWAVAKDQYMRHIINQQTDMQNKVKNEDSDEDSDDEKPPLNVSDEVKAEIKSESDDSENENSDDENNESDSNNESSNDDDNVSKSDNESDEEDDDDDDHDDEDDDEDNEDIKNEQDMSDDNMSETSTMVERKRIKLNDAEDGCTIFLTNVPFGVDNDMLRAFVDKTGPTKYALVCMDKLTEHSKGTAFVKFVNNEDADKFLALPPSELTLEGQVMIAKPALKRESLQKGDKKQAKDNRNLYLVKEGVVIAGTKAAVGVSASDMSKRLALERSKTQMLKNLNRFVSKYRLVVSNLPSHFDDNKLRRICAGAASGKAVITECRVMRDLRAPVGKDGRHPSKGYGFVMFMKHEEALSCLRKLNNNPDIFDKNNRPIVSFSIEDRTALNARKKRLEKSIANNPLVKKDDTGNAITNKHRNRKRKLQKPEDNYAKKARVERKDFNRNKYEDGKFVKTQTQDDIDYSGLKAKEGAQHKMRSSYKLKNQAEIHKQTVKNEKKTSRRALRLKMARKERIKLPKQKINKNPNKKRNKKKY